MWELKLFFYPPAGGYIEKKKKTFRERVVRPRFPVSRRRGSLEKKAVSAASKGDSKTNQSQCTAGGGAKSHLGTVRQVIASSHVQKPCPVHSGVTQYASQHVFNRRHSRSLPTIPRWSTSFRPCSSSLAAFLHRAASALLS